MHTRFLWAVLAVCMTGCASSTTESVEALFLRAESHREAGDTMQAYRHYRRAAKAGLWQAQYALGDFYRLGGFSKTDSSLADTYIRFAAKREGFSMAWYRRSVEAAHRAGAQGDPEAQYTLAGWYDDGFPRRGKVKLVEGDSAASRQWLLQAAEHGHHKALVIVASPYSDWFEPDEAYRFLEHVVSLGHVDAYEIMAQHDFMDPSGGGRLDVVRYVSTLQKGVEAGSAISLQVLTSVLEGLREASANGHADSRKFLDDLEAAGLVGTDGATGRI
jgi:TPR repeat protein